MAGLVHESSETPEPGVLTLFNLLLSQAAEEIHVSVPSEFLMVPMDATLIEQVIINLLENSIRHAGNSVPIKLEVSVKKNRAVFRVSDRGRGIPEEELSRLFTGIPTAKNKSSDSSRGNGIGLSICMSIVKRMEEKCVQPT